MIERNLWQFCNGLMCSLGTKPSRTYVFAWHKEFLEGIKRLGNEKHDRRPWISTTDENILEGDRGLTVPQMATLIGISYGSCQTIITENRELCEVCARWIPPLLTANQKLRYSEICQ